MTVFSPARTGDPLTNRNLDNLRTALASIPSGIGSTPSWIAPTLVPGWTNQTAGYALAGYWKDANGVVWVKAKLTNATAGNLTAGIFTLPQGYRPLEIREFPTYGFTGVAATTYYIKLYPTGDVNLNATTVPSGALVGLMFSFPAEQ